MLNWVRIWILLSSLLVADGWILSACHALNRLGYAVSFGLAALLAILWQRSNRPQPSRAPALAWRKFARRFRHLAPLLFLAIFLLDLVSGFLARAGNGDSNAYRLPRTFHWLWQEHWNWIHTADSRMNIAGCGIEWLFAPLVAFLRTDRWLFLVNILPYVLLPGMTFFIFRRLGVARRAAWWWMWILPTASCFAYQAFSTSNDTLGAVYALAALVFALRAVESNRAGDLWLSFLAAGLLTGLKQTNLPLLLPWLVAVWAARRLLAAHPVQTCAMAAFSLLLSAVPLTLLNLHFVGTWSGFPKDASQIFTWGKQQELDSPVWGLLGNLFCFPAQNLLPPFFPWAPHWNDAMHRFLQTGFGAHFRQFESFGLLDHSVTNANAALGLGIVCLTVVSVWAARCRRQTTSLRPPNWPLRLLLWTPWIALLCFLAKVGTYENARQAAPYYILLFPLLLAAGGQALLVRRRWWQWLALAVMGLTVAQLGFARGRELVPNAVVSHLQARYPHSKFLKVFSAYYANRVSMENVRNFVDSGLAVHEPAVGYATTSGAAEPGWWMPFGRRQIIRVVPGDTADVLLAQNIHYVVVEEVALHNETIEQWMEQFHGEIAGSLDFFQRPDLPPGHLYLVHLRGG